MIKYLLFNGGSDLAITIPANRLLSMDEVDATTVTLFFQDVDNSSDVTVECALTVASGTGVKVMETITNAVHGGRDNFVVVADTESNEFIDANITGVAVTKNAAAASAASSASPLPSPSAGSGISGVLGDYKSWVTQDGNIYTTNIFVDLEGLQIRQTANYIAGASTSTDPAWLFQITDANNGRIFAGVIDVIEEADGNFTDTWDLWASSDGTGAFDGDASALTGATNILHGNNQAAGVINGYSMQFDGSVSYGQATFPRDGDYVYIARRQSTLSPATVDTATAGQILIRLYGYTL